MNLPLFKTLLFASTLFAASSITQAFNSKDIPSYTLRYAVTYKGNSIGELGISLQKSKHKTGQNVIVRGETFPNALANLFGDGKVIETIEYIELNDKLVLKRVTEKKGKKNPAIKKLNVDHQQQKIVTHTDQFAISKHEQIDAYTFPLLSILGLNDSSQGSEEKLVSATKVRHYTYHPETKETITTGAGTFKTFKKSRTRKGDTKVVTIWLTESEPRMPVKIETERKGKKQATIELIKIQK
ncbi:MAG: DUF3108 domain-containing protein [Arenicellales bacterium]